MITKRTKQRIILDIKIILIGCGNSGKSTLTSVLTTGMKDNGRGRAAQQVCKYLHELYSGNTASVSQHMLGFDSNGDTTNYGLGYKNSSTYIINNSDKIVSLIDLAGN